jgi:hypothetical protein
MSKKKLCKKILSYRMVEVLLESALIASSSSQTMAATTSIWPTMLQLQWMDVDSVNVSQSVNGAEFAVIVGASPTRANINAHVNNQPTTGIVDVATGLTRPTSPASSSQFATRLLGNAHQLLLTTTTTQMTTVTMMAKTTYCRFDFASSMQRRRRTARSSLTTDWCRSTCHC